MGAGDLIRSMRSGGGAGVVAAREFLRLAQSGQVTPAEVKEAQQVIDSPELRDAFAGMAQEFSALSGGSGAPLRDVKALRPDTSRLNDAGALGERFLSDLTLVRSQLFDPSLSRSEKAERLFEFFEAYAGRFVELNAEQPLSEAEMQKALARFEKALDGAGFQHLMSGDGRTGTDAARDMLKSKDMAELERARPSKLDAPGWKEGNQVAELNAAHVAQKKIELTAQQLGINQQLKMTPAQQAEEKKKEEERKRQKSRSGVLGGNALWNVMHLMRGDDLTDVQRRDAMNQLALTAAMLAIGGGILIAILVWM
ncbi:MAG: hypothetical protein QM817_24070 [Archangium sp.]